MFVRDRKRADDRTLRLPKIFSPTGLPSMTLETTVEHQTEHSGSAATPWWQKSSIFGSHVSEGERACVVPVGTRSAQEGGMTAVGGAKAQSRFCGKTALPMFREAAKDSEVLAKSGDIHERVFEKVVERRIGQRCDGEPVVSTGKIFRHEWVFSFDDWSWKRNESTDIESSFSDMLAARRWGDGRDSLLPEAASQPKQQHQQAKRVKWKQTSTCKGFAYVGGFEDIKIKLREQIMLPLSHAKAFRQIGIAPCRGVLVYGPSGCGKTHLLSRMGEEFGIHMETVSCSECIGSEEAEQKLKKAFENAKYASPSILFFDNFEVLAPNRRHFPSTNALDRLPNNLFISLLDTLRKEKKDVAVVCATNCVDSIDSSLRRHGRLDVEIYMGKPLSNGDKFDIMKRYLSFTRCEADLDLESMNIANSMQGFMASDVAGLVGEAAFYAVIDAIHSADGDEEYLTRSENTPVITKEHFAKALETIMVPGAMRMYSISSLDKTSWDDIGGLDDVKEQLLEMIEWPTVHADVIDSYGLRMSSGALLYGAPGCGKTLLAKAVATSCKANFLCINGPEILQKWVGESESSIREIFRVARLSKPCVLFIDELDALAPRRGRASTGSHAKGEDIASRIVAQLLCEIDGVGNKDGSNDGVVIIGATNRPDTIDPALLRPGRLSEMIHVPLPQHQSRVSILTSKLSKCPKAIDFDLEVFATQNADLLDGLSGADLTELARRATKVLISASIHNTLPASENVLTEDILLDALKGMRKSVSPETVAYYDRLVHSVSTGKGFQEAAQFTGSSIPINVAVRLTQQAVESKCAGLQARVQELERLLLENDIEFEQNPDTLP